MEVSEKMMQQLQRCPLLKVRITKMAAASISVPGEVQATSFSQTLSHQSILASFSQHSLLELGHCSFYVKLLMAIPVPYSVSSLRYKCYTGFQSHMFWWLSFRTPGLGVNMGMQIFHSSENFARALMKK